MNQNSKRIKKSNKIDYKRIEFPNFLIIRLNKNDISINVFEKENKQVYPYQYEYMTDF